VQPWKALSGIWRGKTQAGRGYSTEMRAACTPDDICAGGVDSPMAVILYGVHPVCEALKKRPHAFKRLVLARKGGDAEIRNIIRLAEASHLTIFRDVPKNLSRLARTDQHQGVVAEVDPFPLVDFEQLMEEGGCRPEKAFFLVLDSLQDPHNVGSLLRSAVCSGVQAVLFPRDRAAGLTAAVAKASAGAIEHVPLCRVVNIAQALERLRREGIWIVGTSPHSTRTMYEFDFTLAAAIVVGSESKGIRPLVQQKCDALVSIPLQGDFDSLNAAVAGAVVLFEAMRQRVR